MADSWAPTNSYDLRFSRYLRIVTATSNYTAANDDELTVKEGDTIILHSKPKFGLCEGSIEDKSGWFPINIVEELCDEEETEESSEVCHSYHRNIFECV